MKTKTEISAKQKGINKWSFEYVVQGNYGNSWEDLISEDTISAAKVQLKCYNENEPNPHRVITRKVLNLKYI